MTEQFELLEEEILRLLEEKAYKPLRELLAEMNPVDIGIILSDLEEQKIPILFRLLPKELASETFVEMDVDAQISAPLLENIFEPNTPLHDGAVVIKEPAEFSGYRKI